MLLLFFLYGLLDQIGKGTFGELGGTQYKLSNLMKIISSNESSADEDIFNAASGSRYSLMDIFYESISNSSFIVNC